MATKNVISKSLILLIIISSSLLVFILLHDFVFSNPHTPCDIKAVIILSTISFYTLAALIAGLTVVAIPSLLRYAKNHRLPQAKEMVKKERRTILTLVSVMSLLAFLVALPTICAISLEHALLTKCLTEASNSKYNIAICVAREVDRFLQDSYGEPPSIFLDRNGFSMFLPHISYMHRIILQKHGACGEHADLMLYLLERLDIKCRKIVFKGIDHNMVEFFINDTWFILDPVYTLRELHSKNATISVQEYATYLKHRFKEVYYSIARILAEERGRSYDVTEEHGFPVSKVTIRVFIKTSIKGIEIPLKEYDIAIIKDHNLCGPLVYKGAVIDGELSITLRAYSRYIIVITYRGNVDAITIEPRPGTYEVKICTPCDCS